MQRQTDDKSKATLLVKDFLTQPNGGFVPPSHSRDIGSKDKGSNGSDGHRPGDAEKSDDLAVMGKVSHLINEQNRPAQETNGSLPSDGHRPGDAEKSDDLAVMGKVVHLINEQNRPAQETNGSLPSGPNGSDGHGPGDAEKSDHLDLMGKVVHLRNNEQETKDPLLIDIALGKEENNHFEICIPDPVTHKFRDDLFEKFENNRTNGKNMCYSFNSAMISRIANLKLEPNAEISRGINGCAMKAMNSVTEEVFILKLLEKDAKLERNEIEVPLRFPDAENIAKCYALVVCSQRLIFIMQDAGISLDKLIECPYYLQLDKKIFFKIMLDIMTALSILAKNGIIHGDIHLGNICVDIITWTAKLVDFGFSKTPGDDMTYDGSTPDYLDQVANKCLCETGKKPKMDEKYDVYAAGIAGFTLFTKYHPIIELFGKDLRQKGFNPDKMDSKIWRKRFRKWISKMKQKTIRNQIKKTQMSDVMRQLLLSVLRIARGKRWTSEHARRFLQEKLNTNVQPRSKLPKQEQQPHCSQREFMPE